MEMAVLFTPGSGMCLRECERACEREGPWLPSPSAHVRVSAARRALGHSGAHRRTQSTSFMEITAVRSLTG